MHVLLIAENWPPRVGGIEHYLTHIARHLPPRSVTVVVPTASRQAEAQPASDSGIRAIQYRRFFWPLIKPAWLPLFITLYRSAKREPVDAVICGKGLLEGLIGYYLKRHLGIPYIVCTYAMEIATWRKAGRTRRKLKRVLKAADRVVYINDATKQTLLELGVQPDQLVKIWPGVDDDVFTLPARTEVAAVLERYQLTAPYLLCVARLVPRKGVDQLIEAFAALDQTRFGSVTLAIVGDGPEYRALEQLAARSFMAASIRFLGAVPDQDLRALYAGAAVFALTPRELPGDFEGFGIVYLEAAAAGVPAVAADSGGAGEAVVHGQTGLVVKPDSIPATTVALTQLLSDAGLRQKLGRQARQRAWDEFRWSKRILLVRGMLEAVVRERSTQTK